MRAFAKNSSSYGFAQDYILFILFISLPYNHRLR